MPFAPFIALLLILAAVLWCVGWVFTHTTIDDRISAYFRRRFNLEVRWLHAHIVRGLLILVLLLIVVPPAAYQLGYQRGYHDGGYFRSHYANPGLCLKATRHRCLASVPTRRAPPRSTPPVTGLPSTASIDLARYPAVGDQGPIGSCAAWASAWAASYEWRMLHPTSWSRFSARCEYDHSTNTYDGGQDVGSFPDQDVEQIPTGGVPRFYHVPYGAVSGGRAAYAIDSPTPGACYIYGLKMPLRPVPLTTWDSLGAGQIAVDAVRKTLAGQTVDGKRHPVLIALPVYPEYDNATQQPNIVSPKSGETDRGGHENVILAYDDTRLMPDGTVGAVLISNQWGTSWGIGGRAWLSYDFLRRYSFGLEYLTTAPMTPHASRNAPAADGGKKPYPPVKKPGSNPGPVQGVKPSIPSGPSASGWYISRYTTQDTGLDISGLVNSLGTKWNIWPVYLLAVVMAESGGNQYAARWGVWPDVSFGLVQVTTQTLTAYYSGCGYNSYCAQSYLDNAYNSLDLGAHILSDYRRISGYGYPFLWNAYNTGAYCHCTSPYYGSFLQNYYSALTYASDTNANPSPQPAPFPKTKWYAWCKNHPHKPCQSHLWKGRLSWAASVWFRYQGLGPVKGHEVYYPRTADRYHGYTQTNFKTGSYIDCWQDFHLCGVYDASGTRIRTVRAGAGASHRSPSSRQHAWSPCRGEPTRAKSSNRLHSHGCTSCGTSERLALSTIPLDRASISGVVYVPGPCQRVRGHLLNSGEPTTST